MTMGSDSNEFDALDRALFALPLEEPPAEMRAAILDSTVYRQHHAFPWWESVTFGVLGAIGIWLIAAIFLGGGSLFVHTLGAISSTVISALSHGATAMWLAAGAATAVWLSLFTVSQPASTSEYRSEHNNMR
jgi:hypothetical protein